MEKIISKHILRIAKKIRAINYLGEECEKCGEDNIFKLTFHHKYPNIKDNKISRFLNNRWNDVEKELKKCELLCHNCHNEYHFSEQLNNRTKNNKKIVLEIKGIDKCEICGYNKSVVSLCFHHYDGKKEFGISTLKTIYEITDELTSELNKCQVLCQNCHTELHSDLNFYEKYKIEIYEKVNNLKNYIKIDKNEVLKMYNDGYKQIEIVKKLKCSKSAISKIIKENIFT